MELIELYKLQILETAIVLGVLLLVNFVIRKSSYRISQKFHLGIERRRITTKIVNLLLLLIGTISIMGIWGLDQKELFVFLTSTLTVLGIGFFASWSILSNITSGVLLYFNHPLHIGDHVKIMDKEYPVEGILKDITMFFMHIETIDGEMVTIPNSVVTQKTISIKSNEANSKLKMTSPSQKNESHEVEQTV
ncbi:MAG: mechanosensitive ion channel family protein [Crocinitomicaceae bacterium]|nr:mechanosensitive ion channel family protein [Crocinitomicaceae bacterium]